MHEYLGGHLPALAMLYRFHGKLELRW